MSPPSTVATTHNPPAFDSALLLRGLPLLLALVLLAAFPAFGGKFYVDLAVKIMILAIFALSLELLVGATGLVCFGQAAFFGIGAYAAVLASPEYESANLAWLLPHVEEFVGGAFPVVRFGGGGAQSEVWAQIVADATDKGEGGKIAIWADGSTTFHGAISARGPRGVRTRP